MKKLPVSLTIFLLAVTVQAQKPSSNSTAVSTGPKRGSLVIVGGDRIPQSIAEKFIALAGGPDANFVYSRPPPPIRRSAGRPATNHRGFSD